MRTRGTRRAIPRRSPLWAKFLMGIGVLVMVASSSVLVYANIMLDKVNNSAATADILGEEQFAPGEDINGPLNYLMIGADLRVDSEKVSLADTIIILHINKNLDAASLISVPRDLKVDITDCGDLYWSPCNTKINDAYAAKSLEGPIHGAANLATTVTELTGVQFDGVAIIDFEGFIDVVKTFGSVELCLPFDMVVEHPKGKLFKKGCKEYGHKDALSIVRERYAYNSDTEGWTEEWGVGDYGRQHMQQHFLKQLMKKAHQEGYTTDPTKVGTLIEEIGEKLVLDLRGRSVVDLAWALQSIRPDKMSNFRVPSEPWDLKDDNGDVLVSYVVTQPGDQEAAAEALYAAVREDTLTDWAKDNPKWVNQ